MDIVIAAANITKQSLVVAQGRDMVVAHCYLVAKVNFEPDITRILVHMIENGVGVLIWVTLPATYYILMASILDFFTTLSQLLNSDLEVKSDTL